MTVRRALPAGLAALALVVTMVTGLWPASGQAAHHPAAHPGSHAARTVDDVLYFDMYAHGRKEPRRIFLTANSGPYLKKITWKHWGTEKAVGRGVYVSDCASCPPPAHRKAVITLRTVVACADVVDAHAYKKGRVVLAEPDEGGTDRTFALPAGCPPS
ncbi:hypothetical protein H5V45_12425 [Nocardioides sp. KIGAM211]|uniref:Uncharacterized protein n=1 Tax=Nocardioides luti TaxID=2761101 RepID=A0A7X0RGX9_9ACTN|nr:hypothetical protein [Nocardioides luti]MBB6628126.1 hypothetical protein [Nocardioides luti]